MTSLSPRRTGALSVVLLSLLLSALGLATAPVPASAAEPCSRSVGPVSSAPGRGKTVALTFDDGPTRFTPQVLRILRDADVRATFFITGRQAAARPGLLAQVAAEGHLIAGHTYDHRYPSEVIGGWSHRYMVDQFRRTNRVLSATTGQPVCFFRPPGGHQSSGMFSAARAHGTAVVMWSVDTEDWKQPGATTRAATRRIVSRATTGGAQTHPLVLFHDGKASHEPEAQVSSNRSNTVAALPAVIAFYRTHGYRFVDMSGRSGLPAEATSMRVKATPERIPAATRSVLSGVVSATTGPVVKQEVTWFSRPTRAGAWKRRGTVTTGASGRFRLAVEPRADTEYRFRLPRSDRYGRTAATVEISTYTFGTDVAVTGPATVTPGDAVTLLLTVASSGAPRAGVTVAVTRTVDGDVLTDHVTTDASGRATFTEEPEAFTRYTLTVRRQLPYERGSAVYDVDVTAVARVGAV